MANTVLARLYLTHLRRNVFYGAGYATNEPRDFEGDNEGQNSGVGPPSGIYYPKMLQQQQEPLSVCRSVFGLTCLLFAMVLGFGTIVSIPIEKPCVGIGICTYDDTQTRDANRSYFAGPFLGAVRPRRRPARYVLRR
eukprot:COSAG02_NODE_307_length_25111_cov_5.306693_10_plen_137_part_00